MTLEQVAGVFNLTRERVRQLEKRALEKLRRTIARLPERERVGLRDTLAAVAQRAAERNGP